MLPLHNVIFFLNYCTIDSTTIFPAFPQHIHTVMFTITLPSILALLFIYASFTQCDIFPQLLHNWLYNNISSISSTYTYGIVYNYSSQYTNCAVYIRYPFHNVIFSVMTAQFTLQQCLQHILNIYTVLFTITLPSILTLLLHMLSFSQYDIFSQLLHNWLYNNVYSISSTYKYGIVYNYTTQYADFAVYICFPFHNVNIFPHITVQLSIWQCLHSIFSVYILYCLQLLSTVYWLCSVYIYFPSTMIMF